MYTTQALATMSYDHKTQFYQDGTFTIDRIGGLFLGDQTAWGSRRTCISTDVPASVYFEVVHKTNVQYDQLNVTKEVYFYTTPKPSQARVELTYDQFCEFLRRHLEAGGDVTDGGLVVTPDFDKMSLTLSDMGL